MAWGQYSAEGGGEYILVACWTKSRRCRIARSCATLSVIKTAPCEPVIDFLFRSLFSKRIDKARVTPRNLRAPSSSKGVDEPPLVLVFFPTPRTAILPAMIDPPDPFWR